VSDYREVRGQQHRDIEVQRRCSAYNVALCLRVLEDEISSSHMLMSVMDSGNVTSVGCLPQVFDLSLNRVQ
jgi:hypothetical protein